MNERYFTRPAPRAIDGGLPRGKRVTLTIEGEALSGGTLRLSNGQHVVIGPDVFRDRNTKVEVVRTPPKWLPGDVVVVRFAPTDTPFTYVRGQRSWPGERFDKTDAQMDQLYRDGKATPVLQSGGVPFSGARLS